MAIKEIPASPSADATVDSTCASSVATSSQHANNAASVPQTAPTSRDLMRRQVLHLGLASSGAASIFILSLVPFHILMGMTVVFMLWVSFLYRLFQMLQFECNEALRGRGIGNFLPASMYDSLVNRSFHDFMTDDAFIRENQHFLLYFIPGLSVDQLNTFVDQLVPRHRRALHRPGLGNFLGEGFMRLLIGDQGLAERQSRPRGSVPQRIEILPNNSEDSSSEPIEERHERTSSGRLVPRRLELEAISEDAASVLGDDLDEVDAPAWSTAERARGSGQDNNDHQIDADSEESEDLSIEEGVVFDAATSGAMNLFSIAFNYSQRAAAGMFLQTSGRVLRTTLGLGVLTVGAGFAGIWAGYWTPQDLRMPRDISPETRNVLFSSTMASGATASLFMLFGWARGSDSGPQKKKKSRSSSSVSKQKKA